MRQPRSCARANWFAARNPLLLGALLLLVSLPATAAPTVLSFDLTTRITSGSGPRRSVSARVLTRNGRVRVESRLGGTPVVGLYAPPYIYRLLPNTKSGTRYRLHQSDDGLQALLRHPSSLRAMLLKDGAKRLGVAKLNGVPVEGFTSDGFRGRGEQLTVWLRRSDHLPLKLEWRDKSTQATALWSHYKKQADSARLRALFVVPANYKIRDTSKPTTLAPGLM